ncbi:FAD-linked oxidase [Sphaerisporangium siamense]|uniref:FAD/FMN-containing dehydrogenase n=1 Tax=Sphaerisporangium siamense TaxID=795645 RepID=A0A7W7D9G3_9ACTN|nr:FAD-dependent oxidoreductase [Sphaerisporangium siamense]MBB4702439.1 FAD/FMN-containing dehydrogenase [Sphaerisporangium siamense]GII88134.1 FAD-linked oxidase [Sphaerisporangium siamense]
MTTIDERDTGVARPGDPAFEAATRVFNLATPARPAAAVTARTIDQIRAAIGHARAEGLSVRVHTTGHASGTARPMDGALLIRTDLEGGVEVDAARRVARVPAGTLWGDVVDAAAPYGLTAPHGSSPTVGVVGYLLRGGLSFYGRHIGLAINSVRAVELVTADGELRRVDAGSDPELFWALRGGGGGFGVVTAVEVALFPAAKVITGATYWPAAHAEGLLSAWRRWTLDAPDEVTTSLRVMNLPPVPGVPPALAAGPVICVDGAVLSLDGDVTAATRQAEDLLGPLRAVAEPVMDDWRLTEPSAVLRAHMEPDDPIAIAGDHMLLREIGDDGAAAFLRLLGAGSGSPFVVAGLRQLGGAYGRPSPGGGALDHLDAHYAYSGAGVAEDAAVTAAIEEHCAKVRAALSPWDTGRTAPSFVENFAQPQGHLSAAQAERADRVRDRVDPGGLFRGDVSPGATAR